MATTLAPDESAALRRLIFRPKFLDGDGGRWRPPPIPPRLAPFGRTIRLGSDWQWRILDCTGGGIRFTLLGRINIRKGNYQAWLIHHDHAGTRLLARMEDHAGHPGLHVHAHCGANLPEPGVTSIGTPIRRPRGRARRSVQGATLDMFWAEARLMFNIRARSPTEPQFELPV